jgi:hypothetical protein
VEKKMGKKIILIVDNEDAQRSSNLPHTLAADLVSGIRHW